MGLSGQWVFSGLFFVFVFLLWGFLLGILGLVFGCWVLGFFYGSVYDCKTSGIFTIKF